MRAQKLLVTWLGVKTKTIESTDPAVTSDLIDLRGLSMDQVLALHVKASSAGGTSDVKVEYKVADNARFHRSGYWYEEPDSALVTPDSATAIDTQINDEIWHRIMFSIEGAVRYMAIVVTGINSNPADTIFQGHIIGM